jgi:hypothetical protein
MNNTVPIEYGEFVGEPVEVPAMRVAGVPQWQSIETAPKDGRTILLGHYNSHGKWRTLRGQWFSAATIAETWEDDECPEGWYETSVECDDDVNAWWTEPTHWKPLDPPPGAAPSPITDAVAPAGMVDVMRKAETFAEDVAARRAVKLYADDLEEDARILLVELRAALSSQEGK